MIFIPGAVRIVALSASLLVAAFPARATSMTPAEVGARIGQALSAAAICPGARVTAKVADLPMSFSEADQAAIRAEADKIAASWRKAFDCVDYDPETRRPTGCRKMKILSCNAAWSELGPEGSAVPGLIEFAAPPEKPDAP